MAEKPTDNSEEPEKALNIFNSLLKEPGKKKISENQIVVILDALANAEDAAIVARFPAILAICARRGLSLKFHSLFSRHWETSPKRQNLEKLLLASSEIFKLQGLKPPKNLAEIAASLKPKYDRLLTTGEFQLSNGIHISLNILQSSLETYVKDQLKSQPLQHKAPRSQSGTLDVYLGRLFPPKQKELVMKRYDGRTFTKTEREYFSRIVRKKLEAIADQEIVALARKVINKQKKF